MHWEAVALYLANPESEIYTGDGGPHDFCVSRMFCKPGVFEECWSIVEEKINVWLEDWEVDDEEFEGVEVEDFDSVFVDEATGRRYRYNEQSGEAEWVDNDEEISVTSGEMNEIRTKEEHAKRLGKLWTKNTVYFLKMFRLEKRFGRCQKMRRLKKTLFK